MSSDTDRRQLITAQWARTGATGTPDLKQKKRTKSSQSKH